MQDVHSQLSELVRTASKLTANLNNALSIAVNVADSPAALAGSSKDAALHLLKESIEDIKEVELSLRGSVEAITQLIATVESTEVSIHTPSGVAFADPIDPKSMKLRTYNSLIAGGIHTVAEACILEMGEMMKFRNFGRESLSDFEAYRESLGLPMEDIFKKKKRVK